MGESWFGPQFRMAVNAESLEPEHRCVMGSLLVLTDSGRLRVDGLRTPLTDRFRGDMPGFAPSMLAHGDALESGEDYYMDPQTGLLVMSSQYLADRGPCCGNSCRHCPFE